MVPDGCVVSFLEGYQEQGRAPHREAKNETKLSAHIVAICRLFDQAFTIRKFKESRNMSSFWSRNVCPFWSRKTSWLVWFLRRFGFGFGVSAWVGFGLRFGPGSARVAVQ